MSQKVKDEQAKLRAIGFPIAVDGVAGPRTRQARRDARRAMPYFARRSWRRYKRRLRWCVRQGGKVSKHFYYRDWKSNGNGWIKVDRKLVQWCERVRRRTGPFGVLSGYRDPAWNRAVGGASSSQHMYGRACDPSPTLSLGAVQSTGRGGIGVRAGRCAHFDTGPSRSWQYN